MNPNIGQARFGARARVVDLLGRQQIADAPTAISELMKNAVDAVASRVDVRYDNINKSLQIEDDGQGMRTDDLLNKWLILATESKARREDDYWEDPYWRWADNARLAKAQQFPPLGEKGIGRLAVSSLGAGVLVWTRWGCDDDAERTLLFIHWHLFLHPRLELADVMIPYKKIISNVPDQSDIISLFTELEGWIIQRKDLWQTEKEKDLKSSLINDLRSRFRDSIKTNFDFSPSPGTLFIVVGTTEEVDDLFDQPRTSSEQVKAQDYNVSEGLKLLLGFSDPFNGMEPRIQTHLEVNGKDILDGRNFWIPEDFEHVDHEIHLTLDENGVVRGRIRRYKVWHDYILNIGQLPRLSRWPGTIKLDLGYVVGKGGDQKTQMPNDEYNEYLKRLDAFGALYVYRDGIRVLPYGRADQDFLSFEERRSFNAGRWFFSHRRMFGAVYLTTEDNLELRDKAGREGFIKNGAYRGMRYALIEIFRDLARSYYGSDVTQKTKKRKPKNSDSAQKAQERSTKATKKFEENLYKWREDLPIRDREIRHEIRFLDQQLEVAENDVSSHGTASLNEVRELLRRRDVIRQRCTVVFEELGTQIPSVAAPSESLLEVFDSYLNERQEFERRTIKRLASLAEKSARLEAKISEAEERRALIAKRLEEEQERCNTLINIAFNEFVTQGNIVVRDRGPLWREKQLEELTSLLISDLGSSPFETLLQDKTGEKFAILERAFAERSSKIREEYLPFWQMVTDQLQYLDTGEAGDLAISSLRRRLETLAERERIFGELAQLGLIVESLDHEYTSLFQNLRQDFEILNKYTSKDDRAQKALLSTRYKFNSLEAKLRLLSPLYRSRMHGVGTLRGDEIKDFIEQLYSEDLRTGMTFSYSTAFLESTWTKVNKPVLLATVSNLVANAIYWTAQSNRAREVRFLLVEGGFTVSDSGPGVPPRDRERIFDPFFGRRPYGRGLGLYIARTNLEAIGFEIFVSESSTKAALTGANFVIRKRSSSDEDLID